MHRLDHENRSIYSKEEAKEEEKEEHENKVIINYNGLSTIG